MHWKNLFYFQKGERVAIIILLILITISGAIYISLKKTRCETALINEENKETQLIEFENKLKNQNNNQSKNNDSIIHKTGSKQEYIRFEKQIKLGKGETIELNDADTTDLKKIPKIGSSFARRIIKYRELLGGYVSVYQLKEVWGMDDYLFEDIRPYIDIENKVSQLNINYSTYKELIKHPYINKDQAKVILDIRERKGNIVSIEHLGLLDEFTENDIKRLKPYLKFD